MKTKEEILERLNDEIMSASLHQEDFDSTSWSYEEGVLISVNEAKAILELIKNNQTNEGAMEEYKNQFPVIEYSEEQVKEYKIEILKAVTNAMPRTSGEIIDKELHSDLITVIDNIKPPSLSKPPAIGYSEKQVKLLLKEQDRNTRHKAIDILLELNSEGNGCPSDVFIDKLQSRIMNLNAPAPSLPSTQSIKFANPKLQERFEKIDPETKAEVDKYFDSQSISDEEIERRAIDYVLVKYPKRKGYTNTNQVNIQDAFIDGFKAAISLTSKEKEVTAPLKFTAGTDKMAPEAGAIEYNGTHLYKTIEGVRTKVEKEETYTEKDLYDFAISIIYPRYKFNRRIDIIEEWARQDVKKFIENKTI